MRTSIPLGLTLAALLILPAAPALAVGQVGDPAAGFTLEDTEGNWHSFEDLRQNNVVLLNMMGYS